MCLCEQTCTCVCVFVRMRVCMCVCVFVCLLFPRKTCATAPGHLNSQISAGVLPVLKHNPSVTPSTHTAVVEAMNAHSAHAGVQEQALGALMNMGGDEDVRSAMVAAGSIPLILEAMRTHTSKTVQMRACGALWVLAAERDTRTALVQAGAVPLILNCMRNHSTEPGAIERAAGALRSLAASSDALAQIAGNGGVELLEIALQSYPAHAGIGKQATGVLTLLQKGGLFAGAAELSMSVGMPFQVSDMCLMCVRVCVYCVCVRV